MAAFLPLLSVMNQPILSPNLSSALPARHPASGAPIVPGASVAPVSARGARARRNLPRTPLERLCDAVDAAFAPGAADPTRSARFAQALREALGEVAADARWLPAAQREGSAQTYRRHLLAADPRGRYAVAALVWMPGQASPIHAHQTWCGYAVLAGTLSETLYDWHEAQQQAREVRSHARACGAVSFVRAGRASIHRLGNAGSEPAVSLHIYGVEAAHLGSHVNDLLQPVAPPHAHAQ